MNVLKLKFVLETKWKINEYVYKMIETLLPKAAFEQNLPYDDLKKFKMIELYMFFLKLI